VSTLAFGAVLAGASAQVRVLHDAEAVPVEKVLMTSTSVRALTRDHICRLSGFVPAPDT
jgi:hypothetical protein